MNDVRTIFGAFNTGYTDTGQADKLVDVVSIARF